MTELSTHHHIPNDPALQDSQDWVTNTGYSFSLEEMRRDAKKILKKYPFPESRQICLTHRKEITHPTEKVYEGSGRLSADRGEFQYSLFNEEFKDTYFAEFFDRVQTKWKVGRTRLALLPPRTCYSMHSDGSKYRFHMAIETNPYCFMAYFDQKMFHIPADGFVYRTNVQKIHSAFNGGDLDRIHLIFELAKPKPI